VTRERADLILALAFVGVFAYAAGEALSWPSNARLFPLAIVVPSLALALLQAAWSARGGGPKVAMTGPDSARAVTPEAEADEEEDLAPRERVRRGSVFLAWILGMLAAIWLIGFVASTALLALAYSRIMGHESWRAALGVTIVSWAMVFGLFDRLLHVPLPPGVLLGALGLG